MRASNATSQSTPSIRESMPGAPCLFASVLIMDSHFRRTSAITHGVSHLVGQVAVGTLADLVLWKPENFGAKPEMVLKSGVIAWAQVRMELS